MKCGLHLFLCVWQSRSVCGTNSMCECVLLFLCLFLQSYVVSLKVVFVLSVIFPSINQNWSLLTHTMCVPIMEDK